MRTTTNYKGFRIVHQSGTPGYIVRSAQHVAKGFKSLEEVVQYIDSL